MFGNLAELAKLAGKAKEIQANMKKLKEELPQAEFSATNANGAVKVTVSGDFLVKSVELRENASADRETLSAEITEAVNNAVAMAKYSAQQKLAEITGGIGLNLPGLF